MIEQAALPIHHLHVGLVCRQAVRINRRLIGEIGNPDFGFRVVRPVKQIVLHKPELIDNRLSGQEAEKTLHVIHSHKFPLAIFRPVGFVIRRQKLFEQQDLTQEGLPIRARNQHFIETAAIPEQRIPVIDIRKGGVARIACRILQKQRMRVVRRRFQVRPPRKVLQTFRQIVLGRQLLRLCARYDERRKFQRQPDPGVRHDGIDIVHREFQDFRAEFPHLRRREEGAL